MGADTEFGGDGAEDGMSRPAEVIRTPVIEEAESRCWAPVDEAREVVPAPEDPGGRCPRAAPHLKHFALVP